LTVPRTVAIFGGYAALRVFEVIRKFSDDPLLICPTCGGAIEKLLSSPAIQFKGTGWYVTDYAGKSGGGKSEGGKDSKEAKDSKDAASKPASTDTASKTSSGTGASSSGGGSSDSGGGEKKS
jgi:putative FmdB family regulatory protein